MGITKRDVPPAVWDAITAALPPEPKRRRAPKPELVAPAFVAPNVWVIPYATVSESNERSKWSKNARTIGARRAISRTLGPHLRALSAFAEHYHRGGELRVTFVRMGGRRLDRSNLATAMKAVEDALCLMMGCDDGSDRWMPVWEQEPGAGPQGVRIELRNAPLVA